MPTKATVNIEDVGKPGGGVTYTLNILESFERSLKSEMDVNTSPEDGASCGVQLRLGVPQLISAYNFSSERYGISSCTPRLPYNSLKLYLTTGQDTYIPKLSKCFNWSNDGDDYSPTLNEQLNECSVWKDAYYDDAFYYGHEDLRTYREIWWNKITPTEP